MKKLEAVELDQRYILLVCGKFFRSVSKNVTSSLLPR
jgi:hypothetical protein